MSRHDEGELRMSKTNRWCQGRWSWSDMLKYCDDSDYFRDLYDDLKAETVGPEWRDISRKSFYLARYAREAKRREEIAARRIAGVLPIARNKDCKK